MQILSKRCDELTSQLKALQTSDSPSVWQGLILGLCACGLNAAGRELRDAAASVLNDAQPLPGALIAVVTELALDAEDGFKRQDLPLLLPAGSAPARLTGLADLCYGLTLGLSLPKGQAQAGTHEALQKINDPQLYDLLKTLQQLQNVDESADLDEADFSAVLSFIENELLAVQRRVTAPPP